MGRGGARQGAGRIRGVPNRINQDRINAFRESGKRDPFDSTIELHEHALKAYGAACKALAKFDAEHEKAIAKARLSAKPSQREQALLKERDRLSGEADKHAGRIHAYAQSAMPYLHAKLTAKELKVDDVSHEQALDDLDDDEPEAHTGAEPPGDGEGGDEFEDE